MQMRATSSVRGDRNRSWALLVTIAAMACGTACGGTTHPTGDGSGGDGSNEASVADGHADGTAGDGSDVALDHNGGMDVVGDSMDVSMPTDGGDTGSTDVFHGDAIVDGDSVCIPMPEACNGRDDNCNGLVDEGLGSSTCGVGECRHTVPNCLAGVPQTCTPGTSSPEVCDGLDNDCNGLVDDALGQTTCGMGACSRTVDNCAAGMTQTCMAGPARAETCNGIDDNCNGMVDEGLGSTMCGVGACQRTVNNCMGGSPQTCTAGAPAAETCNSIDDDCDGVIDNGLGMTTCGMGGCRVTVQNCVAGHPMACTPGTGASEVCNGIDDDCNGLVDDGIPNRVCGVGYCQTTVPGCVSGAIPACIPGTARAETCNGIDDNCNGTVDEGNPGGGVSCVTGMPGVCGAGTTACTAGSIACNRNVSPSAEICDGLDNNCNSLVDEGGATLCPSPMPGSTTTCGGVAGCTIAACSPGTYNVDGVYSNGCECTDSVTTADCSGHVSLTAVPGVTLNQAGNIPATASTTAPDDWYAVAFSSVTGTPNVRLTNDAGGIYRFDVYVGVCPAVLGTTTGCNGLDTGGIATPGTSGGGLSQWTFIDNQSSGLNQYTTRSQTWPSTLYVRVRRAALTPSCAGYVLAITQ